MQETVGAVYVSKSLVIPSNVKLDVFESEVWHKGVPLILSKL